MVRVDAVTGHIRLPADRRSTPRPGPFPSSEPEEAVQGVLEAVVRGDPEALAALLAGPALEILRRLSAVRGPRILSIALKRHARTLLDCRIERVLEIPDGVECRLRLYGLKPGGQIASRCWVAQLRREAAGWRVVAFDRLPCVSDESA